MNHYHRFCIGFATAVFALATGTTSVSAQPTGMKFLPVGNAEQDAQDDRNDDTDVVTTLGLPRSGPNGLLIVDPLTHEKRVDVYALIRKSYSGETIPKKYHNNPIFVQWYVLDLDRDQFEKICSMFKLDSIAAAKMSRALLDEASEYYNKGYAQDSSEVKSALDARRVNGHEYYLLQQDRNEDLTEILTPEQVQRLREQAMYIAVGEFGNPMKFFETAFAQKGLKTYELTPEQKETLDRALAEYVRTVRKANAELVERAIKALPEEHRNAVIDAAGIRGLGKSKDGE